ncbi:MAG: hypothetical protein J1E62_08370 [Lachnospiraceae bacterium]|nr:hypothetical protein [Lachnospiraceae bacterium]
MNNLLLHNLKEIMLYFRNHPEDAGLGRTITGLKSCILSDNNDTLFVIINQNIPKLAPYLFMSKDVVSFDDTEHPEIEWFICDSLDIMSDSVEKGESRLVYELSDMLQEIPDLEYWKYRKNIRQFWKVYVKPVKRKWNLVKLKCPKR